MLVRIIDNDDDRFPGHTLIECIDDHGNTVWRSWAPDDIDPAIRLAPDQYPVVADERKTTDTTEVTYRVPTIDEYRKITNNRARDYNDPEPGEMGKDHHRVLATLAATVEAVDLEDAAEAVQLDEADLVAEAEAWAAAVDLVKPQR
jgi:hypothetical protein